MWHEPIMLLLDHLGVISRSGGSLPVATLVAVAVSEYYPDLVRSGRE